ncbi:aromatic ring-hydroxylating dioxygenase subunit alpha [Sphingomonas profundi]|uniref:aromatic ring-hydroxylating dioxygenase subunit alpha n=1 Tax=Alterirhizorhabdus profundi TaxID=2681549 RepID=UPI0018D0AE1A|nr:aromatic ring-hydroxylating dioxygenase subunit alpha [Sphingomonas profundi]
MYPFKPGHVFVRDTWYVAALSAEIDAGMIERRILDEPVLLYRTEAGDPVAMAGLCPHRRLPLAMGRRVGDAVQCAYHGITFGPDGSCLRVPSQASPGSRMRVRTYPVVERWNWVWIWTGDPAAADPALIPDHGEMGLRDGWEATPAEHYAVPARYQLLIENLQDLSHISYLHGAYVEDAAWTETPVQTMFEGGGMRSARISHDTPLSGFNAWCFPDAAPRVDQELRSVFKSPGVTYSGPIVGETPGEACNGRYLGTMFAVHAITPETPRSTHYFSTTTRDFRTGDTAFSEELHRMDIEVRMQDVVALGAIERHLSDESRLAPEISVAADTPALHVRRLVEKMIAAEQAA